MAKKYTFSVPAKTVFFSAKGKHSFGAKRLVTESDYDEYDLEVGGLDHSGASYEGRIFINNEKADDKTPAEDEHGYAGSFHIFGHGGCFGQTGHCDAQPGVREFDPRPTSSLAPATKFVDITDAVKRRGGPQGLTITVVPVIKAGNQQCDLEDPFRFDELYIVPRHTGESLEDAPRILVDIPSAIKLKTEIRIRKEKQSGDNCCHKQVE